MASVFSTIARGSLAITGSRFLMKAISLVSLWMITKTLSLQDYGVVVLALTVSGPVLVLGGLGLDDTVMATSARLYGEKKHEEARHLLSGLFLLKIIVAIASIAVFFFAHTLLREPYRAIVASFLLPLQAWVLVTVLRTIVDTALQTKSFFGKYGTANVIETFGKLCAVTVFFFLHTLSVTTVLWAFVIGKAAAVLFTSSVLLEYAPRLREMKIVMRRLWQLVRERGKWEILRGGVGQAFSGVDTWMIGFFAGLESVALFAMASAMNSVLASVLPFRQVVFPLLSRMSGTTKDASSFVARRMAKYSVWINTLLIIAASLCVPAVVAQLYPKYSPAIPLFFFLTIGLYLNALSTSHGPLLYARGEQKFLFKLSLFGTLSSFTFLPLLTAMFGVFGAAAEHHLSSAIIIGLRERRLRRAHNVQTFAFKDFVTFDETDRTTMQRLLAHVPRPWHS